MCLEKKFDSHSLSITSFLATGPLRLLLLQCCLSSFLHCCPFSYTAVLDGAGETWRFRRGYISQLVERDVRIPGHMQMVYSPLKAKWRRKTGCIKRDESLNRSNALCSLRIDPTFPIAEACSLQLLALTFVVSASSVVRRKSSLFPMSSGGQRCWLRAYCFVMQRMRISVERVR